MCMYLLFVAFSDILSTAGVRITGFDRELLGTSLVLLMNLEWQLSLYLLIPDNTYSLPPFH